MSLTMKGLANGPGSPWLVVPDGHDEFDQNPESLARWQKDYLLEAFGVDPDSDLAKKTLAQVFLILAKEFTQMELVVDRFGTVPAPEGDAATEAPEAPVAAAKPAPRPRTRKAAVAPQQAAEAQPEGATDWPAVPDANTDKPQDIAPAHPYQDVLDQIEAASAKPALKTIFEANKAAFADSSVMAALQAKATSLG